MYTINDILFPRHVIHTLRSLRGEAWQALVDEVLSLPENHEKHLAFMLLMIRLDGCMGCETDSYRAMRGCTACAHQVLRRFKESDEDLLDMYQHALEDVRKFAYEDTPFRILINQPILT